MVDPPTVGDGCRSHNHRDLPKVTCTVGGSIPLRSLLWVHLGLGHQAAGIGDHESAAALETGGVRGSPGRPATSGPASSPDGKAQKSTGILVPERLSPLQLKQYLYASREPRDPIYTLGPWSYTDRVVYLPVVSHNAHRPRLDGALPEVAYAPTPTAAPDQSGLCGAVARPAPWGTVVLGRTRRACRLRAGGRPPRPQGRGFSEDLDDQTAPKAGA